MSSPTPSHITSVLKETRTFPPPPEFAAAAHIGSMAAYEKLWQRAKDDPEGFWAEQAESLAWFKRWDKVLVWNEPFAQLVRSADGSMPASTASTGIWPGRGATRRPSSGKASRATFAC